MIEAVLFDLDGTLTDSAPGITACIRHALEGMGEGHRIRDDLRWCVGPPLYESFLRLLETDDRELAHRAVTLYR